MKIGQRDIRVPSKRLWFCFTPLGRDWIPAKCAGTPEGFWLYDIPRRFEVHTPWGSFMLALTPGDRWAEIASREDVLNGNYKFKWIEWRPKPRRLEPLND